MIRLFEDFNEYRLVDQWCVSRIQDSYTINEDLSIDVDGDVILDNLRLFELPFKFGVVTGQFSCSYCHLTTLKGFPKEVGDNLYINSNSLTSLEFFPEIVEGHIELESNPITSLKGLPKNADVGTLYGTNLPQEIRDEEDYIKDIINNQDEYNIWQTDGTLNYNRFYLMMDEIKNGTVNENIDNSKFIYNHIKNTNPHIGSRDAFQGIPSLNNYNWDIEPIHIYPDDLKINKPMLYPASKRDVNRYMKAYIKGSDFPPIVLFDNGKEYVIFDGAHRLQAAINLNVPIKAYIGTKK